MIHAKLRNALAIDYPADWLDIVVASDGSIDETNDIVRRFAPRVRLLEFSPRRGKIAVDQRGHAFGRPATSSCSRTPTRSSRPDAVRALVRNFADPTVGAVSGDVALVGERADLGRSEDLYYVYERWLQQAESDIGSMIGADGALYAIRRELFVPAADDTILDDMAIPMAVIRAGRRVVFDATARAYEQGSQTAMEEFARKARVVAGAMQFMSRRQSWVPLRSPQAVLSLMSHKGLRWLSPSFVAGTFVTSIVLADLSWGYSTAAALQGLLLFAVSPAAYQPLAALASWRWRTISAWCRSLPVWGWCGGSPAPNRCCGAVLKGCPPRHRCRRHEHCATFQNGHHQGTKVKAELADLLVCPKCGSALTLTSLKEVRDEIETGVLRCDHGCGSYPITRFVPRFVDADRYAGSFSIQRRYVRRRFDHYRRDTSGDRLFLPTTGFEAAALKQGLTLEAGCGYGRFVDVVQRLGGTIIGINLSTELNRPRLGLRRSPTSRSPCAVRSLRASVQARNIRPHLFNWGAASYARYAAGLREHRAVSPPIRTNRNMDVPSAKQSLR